jgi:hypothetical protein
MPRLSGELTHTSDTITELFHFIFFKQLFNLQQCIIPIVDGVYVPCTINDGVIKSLPAFLPPLLTPVRKQTENVNTSPVSSEELQVKNEARPD